MKKESKRTLRALKERKRTIHSERKRTWCPTLLEGDEIAGSCSHLAPMECRHSGQAGQFDMASGLITGFGSMWGVKRSVFHQQKGEPKFKGLGAGH